MKKYLLLLFVPLFFLPFNVHAAGVAVQMKLNMNADPATHANCVSPYSANQWYQSVGNTKYLCFVMIWSGTSTTMTVVLGNGLTYVPRTVRNWTDSDSDTVTEVITGQQIVFTYPQTASQTIVFKVAIADSLPLSTPPIESTMTGVATKAKLWFSPRVLSITPQFAESADYATQVDIVMNGVVAESNISALTINGDSMLNGYHTGVNNGDGTFTETAIVPAGNAGTWPIYVETYFGSPGTMVHLHSNSTCDETVWFSSGGPLDDPCAPVIPDEPDLDPSVIMTNSLVENLKGIIKDSVIVLLIPALMFLIVWVAYKAYQSLK